MKEFIKYPLVFVTILLVIVSCSEDFLSPEPKSFFTPENVYVDRAGFEAMLVTMRKNITSEQTDGKSSMPHQWAASEAGVPFLQLDMFQLTPSTDRYQNFVSQINDMYQFIKDANVAISRIDDIEWESQQVRNEVLAEALWHRAYWYYRLVGNYGDVPWVGEEVQGARLDFNTYSRWAILEKIQSDLEFAVQWLPETANPGAVTVGAGNHLLSKVYLANMNFDQAVTRATRVIDGPYSLMTERFGQDADNPKRNVIWDLHRPDNKNDAGNRETILAFVDRFEAPEAARTGGLLTMRVYHPSWWSFRSRDSEGNLGMINAGPMYDSLGRGNPDVLLTEWLQYEVWEEDGNSWNSTSDLRRADINWVDRHELLYNNPESVDFGKPWNKNWMTGEPYDILNTAASMPIYKTMVPEDESNATPYGGNGDWYIYRLAETYLIRAEAYYWNDNLQAAADDINTVRERAGAEPITAGDVTIDYIFDERARELFLETPRQNELVRVSYIMAELGLNGYSPETLHEDSWWYDRVIEYNHWYPQYTGDDTETFSGLDVPIGDNSIVIGQSADIGPHHYLWPIDDGLINANTLGTINQNLGYPGAQNNQPPLEDIEETTYE